MEEEEEEDHDHEHENDPDYNDIVMNSGSRAFTKMHDWVGISARQACVKGSIQEVWQAVLGQHQRCRQRKHRQRPYGAGMKTTQLKGSFGYVNCLWGTTGNSTYASCSLTSAIPNLEDFKGSNMQPLFRNLYFHHALYCAQHCLP